MINSVLDVSYLSDSDEVMNNTLEALNGISSVEESVRFLFQDQFGWDIENNEPAVETF